MINKLWNNIFDINIRLSHIIPAKIHTPLPYPSFYSSSMLFKFSSVTEIDKWMIFSKLSDISKLSQIRYSWNENLVHKVLSVLTAVLVQVNLSILFYRLHYFSLLTLPFPMYCGFSPKPPVAHISSIFFLSSFSCWDGSWCKVQGIFKHKSCFQISTTWEHFENEGVRLLAFAEFFLRAKPQSIIIPEWMVESTYSRIACTDVFNSHNHVTQSKGFNCNCSSSLLRNY